ncbi:DUF1572 domain-containing protein [Paenibacillus sp. TRM 82003]|nr:DUF1572 domain-containing protein [Paenibacillus sp. TRM 82003]
MKHDFNREWLGKKFAETETRLKKVLDQLTDERLNWSPDDYSHNIPTLLRHIEGNINERVRKGICQEQIERDRESEFLRTPMSVSEANALVMQNMQFLIHLIHEMPDEKLENCQVVRGKPRKNVEILHQCAAHFSEHLGQILYIAKQCLQDEYRSTSI